jgi:ATP-dependent exoDNAse (exonuclease V) alpha subunit
MAAGGKCRDTGPRSKPASKALSRYTGITRGKKLLVLVGQKKAIAIVVRNVSGRRRWSKLAE